MPEIPQHNENPIEKSHAEKQRDLSMEIGQEIQEISQEIQEAEITAQQKLEILQRVKSFGVRFMNIGEYVQLLGEKELPFGKVSIMEKNFEDWIKQSHDWEQRASDATDWERSTLSLRTEKLLLSYLQESRKEVRKEINALNEGEKKKFNREDVIERFKQKVLQEKPEVRENQGVTFKLLEMAHYVTGDYEKDLAEYNNLEKEIADLIGNSDHAHLIFLQTQPGDLFRDYEKSKFSQWERIQGSYSTNDMKSKIYDEVMQDFREGKCKFDKDIGALPEVEKRYKQSIESGEIPNLSSYSSEVKQKLSELENRIAQLKFKLNFFGGLERLERSSKFFKNPKPNAQEVRQFIQDMTEGEKGFTDKKASQYEVALIFGLIDRDYDYLGRGWTNLTRRLEDTEDDVGKRILGAISLKSDKYKLQELQKSSSESGNWSHPVFNKYGDVYWPE